MSGKRRSVPHAPRGRKSEPIPVEHLNRYKLLEGKIEAFRSLPKDDQKFIIKAVFLSKKPVKCLNCEKKSTSAYGLAYHLERCGLDKDAVPWKCPLCDEIMIHSKSDEHKKQCRSVCDLAEDKVLSEPSDEQTVFYTSSGRISRRVAAQIVEENVDATNEPKRKRRRLDSDEFEPTEFELTNAEEAANILSRPRVSMNGRGHLSRREGSNIKIINGILTGVKIRAPTLNSETRLNKVDVRRFIDGAFNAFIRNIVLAKTCDAVRSMAASVHQISKSEGSNKFADKWSKIKSLPFELREVKANDLSNLTNEDKLRSSQPNISRSAPKTLTNVEFLHTKKCKITTDLKKPVLYEGVGIGDHIQKLIHGQSTTNKLENNALILNCGGPISAMAICPRRDDEGNEVIAISAFNNEVDITLPGPRMRYLQFWVYVPGGYAKCAFLLEIPNSAVLDLAWCPNLIESKQRPNVQIDEIEADCLGLIAVATDNGVIHMYRIPRKLPSYSASTYSINPCATLIHPNVDVLCRNIKLDHDESVNETEQQNENGDEIDDNDSDAVASEYLVEQRFEIPIVSLSWSTFCGASNIAAISEAGRILVWDVSLKPSTIPANIPEDKILNMSQSLYQPIKVIFDPRWESPPRTICWRNAESVAVSFHSKSVMVYSLSEKDTIYRESAYRLIGGVVGSAPRTFEGIFAADSPFINIDGICYSCTSYLDSEMKRSEISSIPNMHQIQAFDIAICELAGIVTTAGGDGRLIQGLSGSLITRTEPMITNFQYGRPILQLLRHKSELRQLDDEAVLPNTEHEQCCTNTWLEIRLGDASLLDTFAVKRQSRICPDVLLDRRTESLTHVKSSPITGGFTAAGGEAGLVFLLPTLL